MSRNQNVGHWGEQAAAQYLLERGFEIAARNVRTPHGEIDLVTRKEGRTVFVEVKARTSKTFGPPEIAVTPRKQAHMIASAEFYAQQNGLEHWQIDVIAVERINGEPVIHHIENAVT